jgi:hypothetical protein
MKKLIPKLQSFEKGLQQNFTKEQMLVFHQQEKQCLHLTQAKLRRALIHKQQSACE